MALGGIPEHGGDGQSQWDCEQRIRDAIEPAHCVPGQTDGRYARRPLGYGANHNDAPSAAKDGCSFQRKRNPTRHPPDRVALRASGGLLTQQRPRRHQVAFRLPPWILVQSPAGSSTKDLVSRTCVAWPAQEWAPSAQSFLAAALMP